MSENMWMFKIYDGARLTKRMNGKKSLAHGLTVYERIQNYETFSQSVITMNLSKTNLKQIITNLSKRTRLVVAFTCT